MRVVLECAGSTPLSTTKLDLSPLRMRAGGLPSQPVQSGVEPPHSILRPAATGVDAHIERRQRVSSRAFARVRDSPRRQSDAFPSPLDRALLIQHSVQRGVTAHTKTMKFKTFLTLLCFAGPAFSQLITPREESGFMSSPDNGFLLTFTGEGSSISFRAYEPMHSSLSFRNDVSTTPIFAENPGFAASLHDVGLHRFAAYSVPSVVASCFSAPLDLTPVTASSSPPSDTFPISPDHEVLALLAAATIP